MLPGSAHGLGRRAPRFSRIAAVPGVLAVLLAVAAAPAIAQQSSPDTVQPSAPAPTAGVPSGSGAQSVPGSQGQSGGGDLRIETPGRDGHCSSKVPVS